MTALAADNVQEISTSTGTGNLTTTPLNGRRRFSDAFGTGSTADVFYYFITSAVAAEWEIGTGHMSAASTLVRDTVIESSNSNLRVSFGAGLKYVCNDLPASLQVANAAAAAASLAASLTLNVKTVTGTTYTLLAGDSGYLIRFTNASAVVVTAPNSLTVGFNCLLEQAGTGAVTVTAAAGATLEGDLPTAGTTALRYGTIALAVQANSGGAAAEYLLVGRVPTADELAAAQAASALLTVKDIAGTTYTLLATDIGSLLHFSSDSAVTVTAPNSLARGFSCLIQQGGLGAVTVTAASGASIEADSSVVTGGKYSTMGLAVRSNVDNVSAIYLATLSQAYGFYSAGTGLSLVGTQFATDSTVLTTTSKPLFSARVDATISADQNDYSPTNFATTAGLYVDGGAGDRNITGLAAATEGRVLWFVNKGTTNNIVLKNQSASSAVANRFLLPADVTLPINTAIELRYDGTAQRWRPASRALADTGVTPGSYSRATLTVGKDGRITAASSNNAGWITLKQVNAGGTVIGTGVTTKQPSISVLVPGGTLGLNGRLRITASWAFTGTNGAKGAGIDFAGTLIGGVGAAGLANTTLSYRPLDTEICNSGSLSSQIVVGIPATVANSGQVGVAPTTPAIDTSVDQTIDVWVQLANGSDTGQARTVHVQYNNDAP